MRRTGVAIGLLVTLALPATAQAAEPQACMTAYTETQKALRAGQLLEARRQAIACGAASCPELLSAECGQWLRELERSIPTVVFDVRDAEGAPVAVVAVSVDGRKVADRADGRSIPLDPGPHRFGFAAADAPAKEVSATIRQGEANQRISVVLDKRATTQPSSTSRPVPVATWIFGSVGLATAAGAIGFGVHGLSTKSDLDACRLEGCAPGRVDDMMRSFAVADVLGAAAIVSTAAAAFFFFTRPTVTEGRAQTSASRAFTSR